MYYAILTTELVVMNLQLFAQVFPDSYIGLSGKGYSFSSNQIYFLMKLEKEIKVRYLSLTSLQELNIPFVHCFPH